MGSYICRSKCGQLGLKCGLLYFPWFLRCFCFNTIIHFSCYVRKLCKHYILSSFSRHFLVPMNILFIVCRYHVLRLSLIYVGSFVNVKFIKLSVLMWLFKTCTCSCPSLNYQVLLKKEDSQSKITTL